MQPLNPRSKPSVNKYAIGGIAFGILLAFEMILVFAAGADWVLSLMVGIVIELLLFVNLYTVLKWTDPHDQAGSLPLVMLVVFSITCAEGAVLGLSLDVHNAKDGGNWDMAIFWESMACILFSLIIFFLPLGIFQYEAYDDPAIRKRRGKGNDAAAAFRSALCTMFFLLSSVFMLISLMWYFLKTATVPITKLSQDESSMLVSSVVTSSSSGESDYFGSVLSNAELAKINSMESEDTTFDIDLSYAMYIFAATTFFGWFLFVIFGGVGLAAVPMSLLNKWFNRPKVLTPSEISEKKSQIAFQTNELIKEGEIFRTNRQEFSEGRPGYMQQRKRRNEDRTKLNEFKRSVFLIEEELDELLVSECMKQDYNPLTPFINLILGIFSAIVSLLWLLQIILFMLVKPSASQFLNDLLKGLDGFFPLFAIVVLALFSGYLLVCVTVGLFKFGIRCFCITLHPMRYGKTLINSFLVNAILIVFCCLPTVHFCTLAFESYASKATISRLVGVQFKYAKFFKYFYMNDIFIYVLVVIAGLSIVYLAVYNKDDSEKLKKLTEVYKSKKGQKKK